jgi:methylase of polypeptide subunit release factors
VSLPRLGTDDEFSAVRQILHSCGFDERGICKRLEIEDMAGFKTIRQGRQAALHFEGPIDPLIRLLLDGEMVDEVIARELLPEGAMESLAALNLVARDAGPPALWFSTALIYPAFGLLMASDRATAPDGSDYSLPPDVVYPAVVQNTRDFIAALPEIPCEAALDLGTGSGIAALLAASRYARHAWGADITPRAVRFAEFNRRLNGIANASFAEGDLYAPVEGMTFDRIITHPPYVPAARTKLIYRDGGEDGEQILRRAVEGLPRFLRPGGRFYAFVMAVDCEGETFEQRIRAWLGTSEKEFDVVLVAHSLRDPAQFIANKLGTGILSEDEQRYRQELWKRRKVQTVFYGSMLLRRRAEERPAVTARVQRGAGMTREHVEGLLDWETKARNPASLEWLMSLRPSIAPDCRLLVEHGVREGHFVAEEFSLACPGPFEVHCRVNPLLLKSISEYDGRRTLREHLEEAQRSGHLDASAGEEGFAAIVIALVSAGILTIAA